MTTLITRLSTTRTSLILVSTLVLVGLSLPQPKSVQACTTFLMTVDGVHLVGKSYDWDVADGYVMINTRGVAKQAIAGQPGDIPLEWVSQYASVTFNQYGREFPQGGMNEAGLVVEIMWLSSSVYPEVDARRSINELQWIQYALDNHASVQALVEVAPTLRVSPVYAAVHYLACDASGDCASFEYLGGELVIATGEAMGVNVLTNHSYEASTAHLGGFEGFGGDQAATGGTGSLARFVTAASLVTDGGVVLGDKPIDAGFAVLDSVSQGDYTVWNIVYEPAEGRVYFRSRDNTDIKFVDLESFELDCTSEVSLLDINSAGSGDVSERFAPYSRDVNLMLIRSSLTQTDSAFSEEIIQALASYPEALACTL